jgi:hypothetical protein
MAVALEELRKQLREKFPQAHASLEEAGRFLPTAALSFSVETFPAGEISEVVPEETGSPLGLLLTGLMGDPAQSVALPELILVDGGDRFDPASFTAAACSKLLWLRCESALEMLRAGELFVKDGNVPFVLLDAASLPPDELKAIPASVWWRLRQLAERTACRLVVLSSFPLIPCASLRLTLTANVSLEDFDSPRRELLGRLAANRERLRRAT